VVDTVNIVRVAQMVVTKVGRVLSAVAVSTVALGALTISPAGASGGLSCSAVVLDSRPHSYGVVTINVSTRPHAQVSGTETAGTHSWSMTPGTAANAAGLARLSQKVAAVRKDELVRVSVTVTLNGSTGHCSTRYTPPSLLPQN
jgi:hypothetical protein